MVHDRSPRFAPILVLTLLCMGLVSTLGIRPVVAQPGTLTFGVMDPRISYGLPSYNTQAVQDADLGMLLSTGASCIRTDIGYDPWLLNKASSIALVDNVVGQIRSAPRCLIIADAAAESYRAAPIPWDQFKTAWVQRAQTIAQRYQPDYYIVVKEPRWYIPMISDATTNPQVSDPGQWVALTQTLMSAVTAVSPKTSIGVSVDANTLTTKFGPEYVSFLQGVTTLTGLSFIGFDVYSSSDQSAAQGYLSQYGSGGKGIWVSEAWSASGPSIYNPSNAQSDATWMNSVYQFAVGINAEFLIPFFTDLFASYTWDTSTSDIVANYNTRQPVFYAYQSIADQFGVPPHGVPEFGSSLLMVVAISAVSLSFLKRKRDRSLLRPRAGTGTAGDGAGQNQ